MPRLTTRSWLRWLSSARSSTAENSLANCKGSCLTGLCRMQRNPKDISVWYHYRLRPLADYGLAIKDSGFQKAWSGDWRAGTVVQAKPNQAVSLIHRYVSDHWLGWRKTYIRCSMRKNLRGSMAREDIYKVAHALSRAPRGAQRDCLSNPPTNSIYYTSREEVDVLDRVHGPQL